MKGGLVFGGGDDLLFLNVSYSWSEAVGGMGTICLGGVDWFRRFMGVLRKIVDKIFGGIWLEKASYSRKVESDD